MNAITRAVAVVLLLTAVARAAEAPQDAGRFSRGLSTKPDFFPLAVWLQDPKNAGRYKDVGVNLYVGLWRGPSEQQLEMLEKVGMPVICSLNDRSKRFLDRRIIVGWMHGDEPDNAQALPGGKGYGPPILPEKIVQDYQRIREIDPTRPVMLNLGQGVAWDNYIGRGVRRNKPEDYPQYVKGCDIASFDIYPMAHTSKEIAGKLWHVPFGVDRLRKWVNDEKPVWCCIETTCISNPQSALTPREVRSEVWMAIIHGAKGIIYFAHQFKPNFIEAGLLAKPEMAKGIAEINAQVKELAPAINSASVEGEVSVESANKDVPIDILVRRRGDELYVFAVAMRPGRTQAKFSGSKLSRSGSAEVLGEARRVQVEKGLWNDRFRDYEVHLYRLHVK